MIDVNFPKKLSIVVPVFNEEGSIGPFLERILPVFEALHVEGEVLFSLDPSSDRTESVILGYADLDPRIKLIKLSRRFGQPAATLAGLHFSTGDYISVIDVDLQDPPEVIIDLYHKALEGYDLVVAQRRTRAGETLAKRIIAHFGYWLINKISDVDIPVNTGDFRLMSRRVVNHVLKLPETHGFLRGLVAVVGFPSAIIQYDRDVRSFGVGKYNPFLGSLTIGFNGVVGFSSKPLSFMMILGFLFAAVSFAIGAWIFVKKLIGFELTPGLPTMVLVVTFFSGIQLLGLGLLGEYVGRIYDEVKGRPKFIVERLVNVSRVDENDLV